MEIQRFFGELYEENTYLVLDQESRLCVLIDPGCGIEALPKGYTLDKILLTHAHVDHALRAQECAERFSAPVYLHRDDLPLYRSDLMSLFAQAGIRRASIGEPETFGDGETLLFGKLSILPVHTPGHTPGSVCYRIGDALFTGDTLMRGTIGRIDFPGGNRSAMLESCRFFARSEDNPLIYPGHGDVSTLRREQESNPYLRGIL